MTDRTQQPAGDAPRPGVGNLASAVSRWLQPDDNPSGVVYGTIAVGAVLAAESTRRETFADTIAATLLILGLYWIAHTYATVIGDRLTERKPLSAGGLWRAFLHEGAIVKGAAIPIVVLVALWIAGASLATEVSVALWTSAAALATFEVFAALRSQATRAQQLAQVVLGALLGAGILLVRVVLH
jgi:hypothetical protein